MDVSIDGHWKIGEGFMHLDNMCLAKLVPVSIGSFQPHVWVTHSMVEGTGPKN